LYKIKLMGNSPEIARRHYAALTPESLKACVDFDEPPGAAGKTHFAEVCRRLASVSAGEVVLLDFRGVDLVTGSWINAMIVPLFRWACAGQTDLFPVLANVREDWRDELELVAEWNHQCYLVCKGRQSPLRRATLVGKLDPAQESTLRAVLKCCPVTGAELERQWTEARVKATAWNNRLRDLHAKRLVRREKKGREQIYSPVAKEITCDGRQLPATAG